MFSLSISEAKVFFKKKIFSAQFTEQKAILVL